MSEASASVSGPRWLDAIAALALALLAGWVAISGDVVSDPAADRLEPVKGFQLDPAQPFRLDFGRGSGLDGLETISIGEGGQVRFHRFTNERRWERASRSLTLEELQSVGLAVRRHGVDMLARRYQPTPRVYDGTQWILWLRQGGREKATYCDNVFPEAIRDFAADLEKLLGAGHDARLRWEAVEAEEVREHEAALWHSLR